MKKLIKTRILIILGLILLAGSCTKDWEEMNVDPNNPSEAPMTNILAHSIRYTGDVFFDDWQGMNNFLSYTGLVTKIQYIDEARYNFRTATVNNAWRDYYVLLNDLKTMKSLAEDKEAPYIVAVTETFSVFLWQMATDQWGDIPYTEALAADEGNNTPAYDTQESIYADLFKRLKDANALFNTPPSAAFPALGDGDLIYGGDIAQWQKFCNSLRLRLAIRVSKVDAATAKATIEEVLGDPTNNPIFTSNADNAVLVWPGVSPYKEPWAENNETRDDHGMAKTVVDSMLSLNDPRLAVYADTVDDGLPGSLYVGAPEGATDGTFDYNEISRIGPYFRNNAAGYTYFMRYTEVEFIIAEAALNGWITGTTAQAAYTAGVQAAFDELGLDATAYLALPQVAWDGVSGTWDNATRIAYQKWIALFKQGQEAWAEQRRTDFPQMSAAAGSVYPGHNRGPFRYPYPEDEKNLNSENYATITGIVDQFWGKQMWWDTRTGVN